MLSFFNLWGFQLSPSLAPAVECELRGRRCLFACSTPGIVSSCRPLGVCHARSHCVSGDRQPCLVGFPVTTSNSRLTTRPKQRTRNVIDGGCFRGSSRDTYPPSTLAKLHLFIKAPDTEYSLQPSPLFLHRKKSRDGQGCVMVHPTNSACLRWRVLSGRGRESRRRWEVVVDWIPDRILLLGTRQGSSCPKRGSE